MNFQSVIDRPDRVRRVMPPTTTMLNTHALHTPSQTATRRRLATDIPETKANEEDAKERLALALATAEEATPVACALCDRNEAKVLLIMS